jgi:hypothetical protein
MAPDFRQQVLVAADTGVHRQHCRIPFIRRHFRLPCRG